ncbi:YfhE family protein [Alteribacter natronophilus]|nr:YfhE family protein [Alteribacter natronophilus]TMW70587.1 YfhE family protein [Alteribacter natronophilus]
MESRKRLVKEERRTMNKAQEVAFLGQFKAADRAAARGRNTK